MAAGERREVRPGTTGRGYRPAVHEPLLRPAGADDDEALRALFAECFPDSPKTRPEIMRWQYWDNPFGAPVSYVHEDAGRIVSHYAGMAVPILFGGAAATGAVGIDAATAPSHRGRGLFESLARAVYYDGGPAHGMPVTLCYPNDNSLRGFLKAGGHEVGRLRTFVLPLDDAWVASRFHVPRAVARAVRAAAFRVGGPASAVRVEHVPDDVDALWSHVAVASPYGIRRDTAWWRWRYDAHPDRPYRLYEVRDGTTLTGAAAALLRDDFGGRFAYLLELLADGPAAARALVAAVADDVGREASGIVTTGLEPSPVATAARHAGLRPLPRRLEPKPLHFGVADNTRGHPDLAAHPWSVAWGDLDHL